MMDMMQQVMSLQVNRRPEVEPQGYGGSRVGGGSHTYQPIHTPLHGQTSHPTMPHFMYEVEPEREHDLVADLVNSIASGIDEYEWLDLKIRRVMSYWEYIHLKERNNTRFKMHYRGGQLNEEVHKIMDKSSARTWVQKLDTFFHLNPIWETDSVQFAMLHLEGDAQEWWYHGLITLGHIHITSYTEFTQRFIERFEREDTDLHFKELAHMR